jgi:hypothetical protein
MLALMRFNWPWTPGCHLLVRLRSGRCFYFAAPEGPTGGRPKKHGAKFVCDDPTTWPEPDADWQTQDAGYGQVRLRAWSGLHAIPGTPKKRTGDVARRPPQNKPIVEGWVIRLEVERLPRPTKPPVPLWFWWWGEEPPDLDGVWRAYTSRFSIEHFFRFCKQVLHWTTPKVRSPQAADLWTRVLVGAYVQLWLAKPLVADGRLPWQRPLPQEKWTPARVRRAFCELLPILDLRAHVPKPCGTSPGRPKGSRSPPAPRFPAVKLTPK